MKKEIYKKSNGYKVYVIPVRNSGSMRVAIYAYIESPQGEISEIIKFKRRDIQTKSSFADVFLDYEGNFTVDDICEIEKELRNTLNITSYCDEQDKVSYKELHYIVSQHIREKAECKEETKCDYFIKDNLGYIKTTVFDNFIKDINEITGYSQRKEILMALKLMGKLKNGNGRPYDASMSINNKKMRYYRIELAEEKEDTVDEEIIL